VAESTLTILKFLFLGLLYLFLARVVHVVVVEMGGGRRGRAVTRAGTRQAEPPPHDAAYAPAYDPGYDPAYDPAYAAPAVAAAPTRGRGRRRGRSDDGPPRLRVLEPPERRGMLFELGEELTVGRAPGCGVFVPDDSFVSQFHARVFTIDGAAWVEDLGSTNGTHLNGTRLESPMPLHRGDHLQVGGTVMEVV